MNQFFTMNLFLVKKKKYSNERKTDPLRSTLADV